MRCKEIFRHLKITTHKHTHTHTHIYYTERERKKAERKGIKGIKGLHTQILTHISIHAHARTHREREKKE
jgi:hypothetical protein